jgi:hypothetical protein
MLIRRLAYRSFPWSLRKRDIKIRHLPLPATRDFSEWSRRGSKEAQTVKQPPLINKQKEELEQSVKEGVRSYLLHNYAGSFSSTKSWRDPLPSKQQNSKDTKLQTLAALNGYQKISLPKVDETVPLAEGIIAEPNFYSTRYRRSAEKDRMYVWMAQPMDEYALPAKKEGLPDLIEEDIKIYRLLENQAEYLLNSMYQAVRDWLNTRILHPIESLIAYGGTTTTGQSTDSKLQNPALVVPQDENSPTTSDENLIVIGKGEIVLITGMPPSIRLLALPHTLGHKRASTFISVSLVIFGAIPLAYRSLNFALAYPGLSELLAASVVGTVTYGLWSSRDAARTRQALVVSNGIAHRVYARNDAVLWVLQEGAVHRLTKAVLTVYYHHLPKDNRVSSEEDSPKQKREKLTLPESLVDPSEIAVYLGLIERREGGEKFILIAVPLEIACNHLQSKRLEV